MRHSEAKFGEKICLAVTVCVIWVVALPLVFVMHSIECQNVTAAVTAGALYGIPVIMNYGIMYQYAVDRTSSQYKAPFNRIGRSNATLTYRDTAVVTPNADTPYSVLWMDLRAEPLVLGMPMIDPARYYSVQLTDLATYNFGYIGSRATGNGAGKFLVAGPGWYGYVPPGIKAVFNSDTLFSLALYRTQLFNASDIANVVAVENGYTVQPLSAYVGGENPHKTSGTLAFLPFQSPMANVTRFFDTLRFAIQLMPSPPRDESFELIIRQRLLDIGVRPGRPFAWAKCASEMWSDVLRGYSAAQSALASFLGGASAVGWQSGLSGGDVSHYAGDWLERAAVAQAGIYANDAAEAIYMSTRTDVAGALIDCSTHNYTLTFAADGFPPVRAFWSMTMYDGVTQLLVHNPLDRYLINSGMLPSLTRDLPQESVTVHIQNGSPGDESNWLPAPYGRVYMVLRLYWPILPDAASWAPPPVVRLN